MAAKKSKVKSGAPVDTQAGATAMPVQPPSTSVVTKEHAPILSKPRKKKKKQTRDDSSDRNATSSASGFVTEGNAGSTCNDLADSRSDASSEQSLASVRPKATGATESSDDSPIDREEENKRHWAIGRPGACNTM
ncbi:hypothetical protein CERZMDRAFT_90889, partial [Cercospora zeae-maydis SCOH1-5]